LVFGIIGAAATAFQMLNLLQRFASFTHRYKWVSIPKDPNDLSLGEVEFDVDAVEQVRARMQGGKDDIRVFTWNFRVRGFHLDAEGLPIDVTTDVQEIDLSTTQMS
jgi:hypothetical protein